MFAPPASPIAQGDGPSQPEAFKAIVGLVALGAISLAEYASRGNKLNLPLYRGLFAEVHAEERGGQPPWPRSTRRWRA
jgi:hypothetical protein